MTRHARTRGARPSPSRLGEDQRRGRPVRERLLGLLSLLTLLSLVTGVPTALIALRGNPLPQSGLDRAALIDALTRPDDGSLFLGAVTWLAWAGWATFAFSVLVEVPAHVRGLPSPRLPALGLPQRAASSLVAGAALLFTLPSFALPSPGPIARPAAAVSVQHPSLQSVVIGAGGAMSSSSQTTQPSLPSYTVMPGDSLWQIAEERLGDGGRYHEIAKLNYDVVQTDGRTLTRDHWIRPGWTLTLPQDARPTAEHRVEDHAIVVQPGDTLWEIAQDALGDGARYEEIAAASTGVQPDGGHLTDPDLIRPGWKVTIPEGHAAASRTPARGQAAAPATPTRDEPRSRIEGPVKPAPQVPDEVTSQPSAQGRSPMKQAPTAHPVDNGAGTDEEHLTVRTAGGVGALLAAGLLVLLARRRARQQRRRGPGQRIAMPPPDLASVELDLRHAEDPSGMHRVDQALRTLSLRLGERSQTLPPLRSASLTAQEFRLTLAEPEVLPAPFASTADPRVWVLPASSPLPPDDQLAAVPAPYPSLVTVGQDRDGAQVLLDLEFTGALAVLGESDDQVAVLAAIAAELATSPWADDLQITLVGCLEQLPEALGTGRVTHVDDVEKLLPVLEHRGSAVRAALQSQGLTNLRQARTARPDASVAGACWPPDIVLIAGPIPPALSSRLSALLQNLPRAGTAVVTAGDSALSEWQLTFGTTEPSTAVIAPLNLALQPQKLTTTDLDQLLSLLAVADQPSYESPDPSTTAKFLDELLLADVGGQLTSTTAATHPEVPNPPDDDADVRAGNVAQLLASTPAVDEPHEPAPEDATPPPGVPLIQVLGPVEILNAHGPVEPSKMRQLTEIAAFMALNPGSDHHGLSEAIWPGARAVDNTRNTAVSKLRKWLGVAEDGSDYVPWVLDHGYRLHPRVRSDWQMWQELLSKGVAAATDADLATALDLVKGRPFAGTNPRRYAWAERERQDMISAIVDASHELASRALHAGDAMLARRAAAAGLQVDPGTELLWRDALKADWLAGDREGLISTADRLSALVEELGDDLEPETIELMDELLRRRSRQVGVR